MRRALALLLCVSPALAEAQTGVVEGRLLPGWRVGVGAYMAALQLDLAPEWKTYWRAPGEAGIAPAFDWSGSKNVKAAEFHWPTPEVTTWNGLVSIGYYDTLTLPFDVVPLDAAKPVEVALKMQLGVCKDICVPGELRFGGVLGGGEPDPAILAALNDRPRTGVEAGLSGIACDLAPIEDGLRLTARIGLPRQGDPETVVFETSDSSVWVAEAQSSRSGGMLTAETDLVPPTGAPFALDRSGVTVTVLAGGDAVEIRGCPAP